ncbi:MAG: hypothetical protein PVI30_05200 [Myxococcales bacterium]
MVPPSVGARSERWWHSRSPRLLERLQQEGVIPLLGDGGLN